MGRLSTDVYRRAASRAKTPAMKHQLLVSMSLLLAGLPDVALAQTSNLGFSGVYAGNVGIFAIDRATAEALLPSELCSGPTTLNYIPISFVDSAVSVAAGFALLGYNEHLMSLSTTASSWGLTYLAQSGTPATLTTTGATSMQDLEPFLSAPNAARNAAGLL
jgi:hypothetical protein